MDNYIMNKITGMILSVAVGSLLLGGCGDAGSTGSGSRSENLVDPSDPDALSEVLIIPGAVRVQGTPPQASSDPNAPVITGGNDLETLSGDQAVLEVSYDSPSGYTDCYVQVLGAADYFVISVPSDVTLGTLQIPVNIPENVDSGVFDLYTCIVGDNGFASNAVSTSVGVTYSGTNPGMNPGGGGDVICASDDPSVGTMLPCGNGTTMLDFCIDQDSGSCFYTVGGQQVGCGNCLSGGFDITCAERAAELCF
jgi:hypothetical protein